MKKVFYSITLILSVFLCMSFTEFQKNHQKNTDKIICSATIDDHFANDSIIVALNSQNINYSINDFKQINCSKILDLTSSFNEHNIKPDFKRLLQLFFPPTTKENILNYIKVLESHCDIYFAEPNYTVNFTSPIVQKESHAKKTSSLVPSTNYPLDLIGADDAWNIATGMNVKIAIIDTGIYEEHEDLVDQVDRTLSYSYVNDNYGPFVDLDGHGSAVSAIIAAKNNDVGIKGLAYNAKVVSYRCLPGGNHASNLLDAINRVTADGIKILNLSRGIGDDINRVFQQAFINYNGLVVCSAGNSGYNNDYVIHYPSSYRLDNVITVGASNSLDEICGFSNYGKETVDLFAPGVDVYSVGISSTDAYDYFTGTSFSAPFVSACVALMIEKYPELSLSSIKKILLNSVDKLDSFSNKCVSDGRLNAYKALSHEHTFIINNNGSTHTKICIACDYIITEQHTYLGHICKYCNSYTSIHSYTFKYIRIDSKFHYAYCTCGEYKKSPHIIDNSTSGFGENLKICKLCKGLANIGEIVVENISTLKSAYYYTRRD